MNILRYIIRHLFAPSDTDRAVEVSRDLMAETNTRRIYVVTYRTPAGREFTRTVKEATP